MATEASEEVAKAAIVSCFVCLVEVVVGWLGQQVKLSREEEWVRDVSDADMSRIYNVF